MSIYARLLPLLVVMLLMHAVATVGDSFQVDFSEQQLDTVKSKYGDRARKRVVAWVGLITEGRLKPEEEKLRMANDFFNQLLFVSDLDHWGKNDYWATPMEMLGTGGGDCEDYSISKYFTLLAMGVDSDKLKITYVKATGYGLLNAAHMVLAYYSTPSAIPVVLDNLDGDIKPADKRSDLTPVYSFNGDGLWLAKERGSGKRVDGGNRISLWRDMMTRMGKEI